MRVDKEVEPLPKAKKKPTRKKVVYGAGAKGECTRLHSKIVRARANGRCERCGRTDKPLECSHIVARRYSNTRTDESNAWALDWYCHHYLTEHPDKHVAFAVQTRGADGYRALLDKAYSGKKFRWDLELARLQQIALELGI